MSQREYKQLIADYIQAKDQNRPHLIHHVFSADAVLDMHVASDSISFPAQTMGAEQICEVLVRRFALQYENIYTYCLTDTIQRADHRLNCRWLVCMSNKETGEVLVGWGVYNWHFTQAAAIKVASLRIHIEKMSVLEPEHLELVMAAISPISYPWCASEHLNKTFASLAKDIDSLAWPAAFNTDI